MWYTRPLHEFHGSVVRTLNETTRALENLQENVAATSKHVDSVADAQNSLIGRVDGAEASRGQLIRELGERLDRTEQLHTHRLEERLRLNERNFRRVAYMLEQKSHRKGAAANPETPPMFRSDIPSESEFDYFLFEERFRGSENDIKNRQRPYMDIFRGRENVIDLGCGRGEFLELMQENKVPARGVESNTDMFLLCREKGLEVLQENLFDYLESVPDASIGGIFCSQVIEHLPSGLQIRLVALSHKKLKPGSPLVVETINPECLLALSRNFFLDPTHVRPVHPEMLRFLLESLHFEKVELQFNSPANFGESIPKLTSPHAASDLVRFNQVLEQMNAFLFGHQDYTVVGYR
jgi:O-antigen chain-terminating methyltransferase